MKDRKQYLVSGKSLFKKTTTKKIFPSIVMAYYKFAKNE